MGNTALGRMCGKRPDYDTATAFSASELENLKSVFNTMDTNGNGDIDKTEFKNALEEMGDDMSDREIDKAFAEVDADGSGTVDFDEFVELTRVARVKGKGSPGLGRFVQSAGKYASWVRTSGGGLHAEVPALLYARLHTL